MVYIPGIPGICTYTLLCNDHEWQTEVFHLKSSLKFPSSAVTCTIIIPEAVPV